MDAIKVFRDNFNNTNKRERANYDSMCRKDEDIPSFVVSRLNTRLHMFAVMIGKIRYLVNKKGYRFAYVDQLGAIFRAALLCQQDLEKNEKSIRWLSDHMKRLEHDLRDIDNKFEWECQGTDIDGIHITYEHFLHVAEWLRDAEFESDGEPNFNLEDFALLVVSDLQLYLEPIWHLQAAIDKKRSRSKV